MRLRTLELFAYRNHAQVSLAFESRLQLITGANARGKTNLVEAVYVLATGRSFRRQAHNRDLIRSGEDEAALRGRIERDGLETDLSVRISRKGQRRLIVNNNEVHYLRDYVRHLSVVAFQPEDLLMVRGGPDLRREFMDRAAFTLLPEYLDDYNRYQRALAGRNQLLKEGARGDHLGAWTEELATTGARLAGTRRRFLDELLPDATAAFADIFGGAVLQLGYEPNPSRLNEASVDDWRDILLEELWSREADDRERGFTTIGPHRDDLAMRIDGRDARQYASQGQTRALVLALRIAQIRHAATVLGSPPLFILDDVGSELDEERRGYLTRFLGESGVQALVTATEASLMPGVSEVAEVFSIGDDGAVFRV